MANATNPLLTIITVSLNSEKYIRATIESVLKQDYEPLEYLIIDGGSTDHTINIVQEYEAKFTGQIKWLSEKDQGIYDAFNKGIKLARGDIIGIINSDDFYEPGIFSEVVKTIKSFDLLHGNLRFIDVDGQVIKVYGPKIGTIRQLISTPYNHPTMFVKKYVYDQLGLFNTDYRYAADYDLMLRFNKSNFRAVYLNKVIANMRTVGVTSGINKILNPEDYKKILTSFGLPLLIAQTLIYYRLVRAFLYEKLSAHPKLIKFSRIFKSYHLKDEEPN